MSIIARPEALLTNSDKAVIDHLRKAGKAGPSILVGLIPIAEEEILIARGEALGVSSTLTAAAIAGMDINIKRANGLYIHFDPHP